jgi:hypothetical protein
LQTEIPPELEHPACETVADTGGINLLPYPRVCMPRGSPFRVPPAGYLYVSARAIQSVRRKFLHLSERLAAAGVRLQVVSAAQLAPMQAIYTDSAQFPKWVHLDSILKGDASRPGGYRIFVNHDGVMVHAADDDGVQHACATLLQLVEDGPEIPGMEVEDYPLLRYRAVHLDLKGWQPGAAWLKRAITELGSAKINVLLLEYETHFDYPSVKGLSSEGALKPQELQELDAHARDCGIALAPFISCVGNAEHILRHPEYASLREHSEYAGMFSLCAPDTLNLLLSMLNDLLPLHGGKLAHIGGDGAFFLGRNPLTLQRVEQLGSLDAVYLDYVGGLCRFLAAQGVQPLVWDESIRGMSDDQIKWLPPEAILAFWMPNGIVPAQAKEVLAQLERYKALGCSAWGAVQVSPAQHYDAFDHVDAWAEFGDLNYISGLIASVRTREHFKGGLMPPFESVWPAVFYAADRAWHGKQTVARETFPARFVMRFFGLRSIESRSRMWAGCDRILADNPLHAQPFFKSEAPGIQKNAATAAFLQAWCAVRAFLKIFEGVEAQVRANFYNIQTGAADPLEAGQLRWRVLELKAKAPDIIAHFSNCAVENSSEMSVLEFVESSIAYTLRRLDELEPLLAPFPLPADDLKETIDLM